MEKNESKNGSRVRSVERALSILNCFGNGKTGLSLVEIAKEVDLTASTTLRLLSTLLDYNYLYRDPSDQRFYLGQSLARISSNAFLQMDIHRIAHPYLEELKQKFNEGSGLYLLQGEQRICIDRVESDRDLRRVVQIGSSLPLTIGAAGRVILAHLPEEQAAKFIAEDPRYSQYDLARVRERGYSISRGEREEGLCSIAAPVFNAKAQVIAALFISGPVLRMTDEVLAAMAVEIKSAAEKISQAMGFYRA